MAMLEGLFASGRIIDLILVLVAIEAVCLAVIPRLRGSMGLIDIAGLLLPGVMLMLSVRTALTGAPHTMTAAMLAAALVFHLLDVARRRA